jgi:phosphatidate cytidylyltransferase
MGDVGAFAFGKKLGKHKLIPAVSPGKTIEGCIGGLVTSAGVSVGIAMAAGLTGASGDLSILTWVGLGALIGAVAQAGDLFESLLKREAGVKDSGAIVPQFGGVLDMIDGLLVAAPVVWFLAPWRW